MEIKNVKHERDDLHTLKQYFQAVQKNVKLQTSGYEEIKHAVMRNGECTSKMYTLHEDIHKNVLPSWRVYMKYRLLYYLAASFIKTKSHISVCPSAILAQILIMSI